MAKRKHPTASTASMSRVARYFWPHLAKHRLLVSGSLLALIAETGLRLLEPWPLKLVFDRIIAPGRSVRPSGLPLIDGLDPVVLLTVLALATIAITGLRSLSDYANTVGFALVSNRVLADVRSELYARLQSLSLSFHTRQRSGELTARVTTDVGLLTDVTVNAIVPLLGTAFVTLGMLALMFWLRWTLALLALAPLPLLWLVSTRLSVRIREAARKQRQKEGAIAATTSESIGSIKLVQALSLEGTFARIFSQHNVMSLAEGVRTIRLAASLERTVDLFIAGGTALVLWYGAVLVLRHELTPGDLLVFLAYLKSAYKPIQDFAKYTNRLARAGAAAERVLDLLDECVDVRDRPSAVRAPRLRGAVQFDDVSFAYDARRLALDDVAFAVEAGQTVALVGPSGSGKSTLVSLILRLYDPTRGRVLIDGRDAGDYTLQTLRTQMSVVLQDSLMFAATVRENIAYGTQDGTTPSAADVEAAARLANAHDFIAALPEGYDTVLGERGVTISSGQRQRIAIARAAVRQAPILILDEPTTGLDEENERIVVDALQRLARGRTTFLITHELRHAENADRILYLEGGRLLEQGTHAELMEQGARYAALYRLQEHERAPENGRLAREGSLAFAS